MSHTAIIHGEASRRVQRYPAWLVRILLGAPVLAAAAGLMATLPLDHIAGAIAAPQPVRVAASQPAAHGDTSVPDAAAVFAGREVAAEKPCSNF